MDELNQNLGTQIQEGNVGQQLPFHTHNGVDSPNIEARNLIPLPISLSIPAYVAAEGTMVIYWDGATTYTLYIRINSAWKSVALT